MALRSFDVTEGAVVLHYACCSAQGFAGKDWHALGYLGSGGGPWAKRWHLMQAEEANAEVAMANEVLYSFECAPMMICKLHYLRMTEDD